MIGFGILSMWQWNRAEEKRDDHQLVIAGVETPAVPLDEALTDPIEWQHVKVSGSYGAHQHLLRNRPLEGRNGFWVITPLIADANAANAGLREGDVVWVARGWMPQSTAASQSVEVPAAPTGSAEVTGYLRATSTESARPSEEYPQGQIAAINGTDLNELSGLTSDERLADWYVLVEPDQSSASELTALPLPESDDARNLSYAGQWLLFASITIGGWFYFLWREAREGPEGPQPRSRAAKAPGTRAHEPSDMGPRST
jgi:cytochrome oxidase assembly protein ShyY1